MPRRPRRGHASHAGTRAGTAPGVHAAEGRGRAPGPGWLLIGGRGTAREGARESRRRGWNAARRGPGSRAEGAEGRAEGSRGAAPLGEQGATVSESRAAAGEGGGATREGPGADVPPRGSRAAKGQGHRTEGAAAGAEGRVP
jgi:hypothetical protein